MRNLDVGALTAIFDLLQQHYPERLGELWFLNAPFLFWGLWSVVKPCVKPSTREKIRFLSNSEKGALLAQTIPAVVSGMLLETCKAKLVVQGLCTLLLYRSWGGGRGGGGGGEQLLRVCL